MISDRLKKDNENEILNENINFRDVFISIGILLSFAAIFSFVFSSQSLNGIVNQSVRTSNVETSVSVVNSPLSANAISSMGIPPPPGCSYTSHWFALDFHYNYNWNAWWGAFSGNDSGQFKIILSDSIGYSTQARAYTFSSYSYIGQGLDENAVTITAPSTNWGSISYFSVAPIPVQQVTFNYKNLEIQGTNSGAPQVQLNGHITIYANWVTVNTPQGTYNDVLSSACMYSGNFNYYCGFPIASDTTLNAFGN